MSGIGVMSCLMMPGVQPGSPCKARGQIQASTGREGGWRAGGRLFLIRYGYFPKFWRKGAAIVEFCGWGREEHSFGLRGMLPGLLAMCAPEKGG